MDKYLLGREIEVDAICDGENVLIPGIMEHVERAGIHSGDSISVYPPQHLAPRIQRMVTDYTINIARSLHVRGLVNIQFIEYAGDLYIIEVNPRSSRTVPYISKVTGIPIVELAFARRWARRCRRWALARGSIRPRRPSRSRCRCSALKSCRRSRSALGRK